MRRHARHDRRSGPHPQTASVDSPDGATRAPTWRDPSAGEGCETTVRARAVFGALRLAAATACTVALVHRLFWGLSSRTIAGDNFFAYLTVQSNCALVVVLVIGAALAFARAQGYPLVVKPRAAAGAAGTTRVDSDAELTAALDTFAASGATSVAGPSGEGGSSGATSAGP